MSHANINDSDSLYGVQNGILYGQNERVDELNDRISSRSFSDMPLEPQFSPRPVPTKYSLFPVIDRRAQPTVPIQPMVNHRVSHNFSPATANAPPQCYLANINTETMLRNQNVALQRGADQGIYVPASTSDLYRVSVTATPGPAQPFPDLFSKQTFQTKHHPNLQNNKIGVDRFHNHTRTQLRDM